MKLAFVNLCGFRGFSGPIQITFSNMFTIIDGRNGVGKSTIFDAVEFALTGTISKYLDAKASGESVDDYLWWSGDGDVQGERYVEVGFNDGAEQYLVKRTPFDAVDLDVSHAVEKLVDRDIAPKTAITQLCAATIIRDEHIARLSLDLNEGQRFTLLRDAIGATDADEWTSKASKLASAASARVNDATTELEEANISLANAVMQLDQVRSELSTESFVGTAISNLQSLLDTTAPADELGDIARKKIVELQTRLELINTFSQRLSEIEQVKANLSQLERQVTNAEMEWVASTKEFEQKKATIGAQLESTDLSLQARQLENLANLGREIGTKAGHCPLCNSEISEMAFNEGLESALIIARQLDVQAVEQEGKERALKETEERVTYAKHALDTAIEERKVALAKIAEFNSFQETVNFVGTTPEDLTKHINELERQRVIIENELRILDTISLNRVLEKAMEVNSSAKERVERAEARLGRVRLAERRAKTIHDSVRRAAAESLDQRLGRILPLMSELYKRLRPHPIWDDIEYSVRGDVRRFLKLQVGSDVNPQFVFSSGQRRATGLAFLLSMNLSIAWSRWRSILLDDPVQHVDDFRATSSCRGACSSLPKRSPDHLRRRG